ncbi:sugar ABC transporter [Caballeronia mineralivorans PML1(12)]|uniref:Sugar ABC transporter n=1 Tax=Caballeronia mineralivorans PML1(12) TaxID=908627 RepID=A0A0J1CZ46_9BURK|nr:ABC transporter ATP-binding protein [Caballeronia mineralivorans]KLU25827.1 sugar ABC transporter [Caballeronia mineralivorans PML1(12)]
MSELRVTSLTKSFDGQPVLHGVDLSVERGTLLALLGPSGSGKTTLLRVLCGFERADGGTVEIDGVRVAGPGVHVPSEARRIGYVPQEGALFPHLSVADNIVFGLPRQQRRARYRVDELLALVGLPAAYGDRPPQALSGGQQQRVALARALAPSPSLVMLDEPFSSLDAALRIETREAVANALAATGATAVLVTHDQAEALSLGHEVAVLWRGRLVQTDSPEAVYRRPVSRELASFVGDAVIVPGSIHRANSKQVVCEFGTLPIARAMTANDIDVDVMIRPEQIRIVSDRRGEGDGVEAVVEKVVFYGHDASVMLRSVTGARGVQIRVAGHSHPRVGERISLSVEGDVVAYPKG